MSAAGVVELLGPGGLALVAGLVGLAVYLWACQLWPYARCPRCRKSPGRRLSWWGRSWGDCRWCGGRGKRVRVGRRILDSLRSEGAE
jgi:hypothetical protein